MSLPPAPHRAGAGHRGQPPSPRRCFSLALHHGANAPAPTTTSRRRAGEWTRMAATPHTRSHPGSVTHHALPCQRERRTTKMDPLWWHGREDRGADVTPHTAGRTAGQGAVDGRDVRPLCGWGEERAVPGRVLVNHRPKDNKYGYCRLPTNVRLYASGARMAGCHTVRVARCARFEWRRVRHQTLSRAHAGHSIASVARLAGEDGISARWRGGTQADALAWPARPSSTRHVDEPARRCQMRWRGGGGGSSAPRRPSVRPLVVLRGQHISPLNAT